MEFEMSEDLCRDAEERIEDPATPPASRAMLIPEEDECG
jgi:hypothetical protein